MNHSHFRRHQALMLFLIMNQILLQAIHGIELRTIHLCGPSHVVVIVEEIGPFSDFELLLGVDEVEVILIYLKGSYIAQRLLLLYSPASDVVGQRYLPAADWLTDGWTDCLTPSLRHIE